MIGAPEEEERKNRVGAFCEIIPKNLLKIKRTSTHKDSSQNKQKGSDT